MSGGLRAHHRSGVDRRSGVSRRRSYPLEYFIEGGRERRSGFDRRSNIEPVTPWMQPSRYLKRILMFTEWNRKNQGCPGPWS